MENVIRVMRHLKRTSGNRILYKRRDKRGTEDFSDAD